MTLRNIFLFLLGVLSLPPCAAAAQSSRKVTAKFTWEIGNAQNTSEFTLRAMIPGDIAGRQRVNSVQSSVYPNRDVTDESGSRYVVFNFKAPDIPKEIIVEVDMELYRAGLSTQRRKKSSQLENKEKYLGDEKHIMPSDPRVKALAARLRGKTEEETVQNILTYLAQNMTYGRDRNYTRQGNVVTLDIKQGVCGDYSDLMIALCRANGIPARTSGGYLFSYDFIPGWDGDSWHVWVDVYLQSYGWTPFEATTHSINGWRTMDPLYIYIAQDLNNSALKTTFTYTCKGWRPRVDSFFSVK